MVRSNGPKDKGVTDDGLEEINALHKGMASRRGWYQGCIVRGVQVCQGSLCAAVA